jgi:hypothetical protein
MATRAVYTFRDNDSQFHVYKHWDGYPEAALEFIAKAQGFAWDLPRYEAADFAAAFVVANKKPGGGDVYLTTHWENHSDLDYRYLVEFKAGGLEVRIYEADEANNYEYTKLFQTVRLADHLETVRLAD